MRKLFVIFTLFLLVFPVVRKTCIIVSFNLNRDEIAAESCIEKENPNSCCKGSCVLKNDLKETESADKTPQALRDQTELQLFFSSDEVQKDFRPIETDFSFCESSLQFENVWLERPDQPPSEA